MSEWMHLCLSDLLDQDLSSYEYFHALPAPMQNKLLSSDVRSFEQMQNYVAAQTGRGDADGSIE